VCLLLEQLTMLTLPGLNVKCAELRE